MSIVLEMKDNPTLQLPYCANQTLNIAVFLILRLT